MDYIKSQYDISDWEMDFTFFTEEEINRAYKYLNQYMWSTFKVNDKEVVHKSILRAMKLAHQYDPAKSNKWTWLSMICRHVYLSKDSRSNKLRKSYSLDEKIPGDDKKTFAQVLAADEEEDEVDSDLISREVKWLVQRGNYPYLRLRMTGMSYEAIGEVMGVKLMIVKNNIHKERKLLKKYLIEFGDEEMRNHIKSRRR